MSSIVDASQSGFYVDNGFDQTVMHRTLTPSDAENVEHKILDLLGLPDRPSGLKLRHPSMRKSAPKFLLDMYRRQIEQENEAMLEEDGVVGGGRHTRSADDDANDLVTANNRDVIEKCDGITAFFSKSEYLFRT